MRAILVLLFAFVFSAFGFSLSEREFLDSAGRWTRKELIAKRKSYDSQSNEPYSDSKIRAKILDFYIYQGEENIDKRLEVLIWLTNSPEITSKEYQSWAYYHISTNLSFYELRELSIEASLKSIELSKQSNNERFLAYNYSTLATTLFHQEEFKKALKYFKLCANTDPNKENYQKGSDYNNLGLCYQRMKNFEEAIRCYKKGLTFLQPKNHSGEEEVHFLIKGNLGSALIRTGKYREAEELLTEELSYYDRTHLFHTNRITCLIDFVRLYAKTGRRDKIPQLTKTIKELCDKEKFAKDKLLCLEKLKRTFDDESILPAKTDVDRWYNEFLILASKEERSNQMKLTRLLYEDKINSLTQNSEFIKENANLEKKNQRLILWCFIIGFTLAVVIVFLISRSNKRKLKQSELALIVQMQKEEIARNEQIILEQQILNQKQQLHSLTTNLSIKQKTESGFLEKIKELKRNKNASTDMIYRELQLALNNLLDIDKKLISESELEFDLNEALLNKIRSIHPELNPQETIMCTYFISDLSAKEIGLLMNLSDVSVRVAKNKIKNKIGLHKDKSLDEYLKSLNH